MHPVESERIVILDVLRGIALFGMLIVHFNDSALVTPGPGSFTSAFVDLFIENKSFTIFAMLFGVGFALQIHAAQARGEKYRLRLLRRLIGVGLFGIIAEGVFGFHVLTSYAIWGLPLMLMWRWSTRALLIAALLCSASLSLFNISAGAYQWATLGVEGTRAANREIAVSDGATRRALAKEESKASFRSVVAARMANLKWHHTRPFSFTPWGPLVPFLVGLLALRHGVFEHPNQHRRLILAAMAIGLLAWIVAHRLLPLPWPVLPILRISRPIQGGFQIIREQWLALTYVGALLLAMHPGPNCSAAPSGSCGQGVWL